MAQKPFDPNTYAENDNAKNLVVAFLKKWGFTNVHVNPDKYGIDLLAERIRNGRTVSYGVEVEVKHNWSGSLFPFSHVHYAARKVKFLNECEHTYFIMCNTERTHLLIANEQAFDGARIVRKDTSTTTNEWFMQVPLERCLMYEV